MTLSVNDVTINLKGVSPKSTEWDSGGCGLTNHSAPFNPSYPKGEKIMDENKLTIKDIVGLALKGWSKEDIKELFSMAQTQEQARSEEAEQKAPASEPANAEAELKAPEEKPEEKPDNIEDIDAMKKQISDLKALLKESQQDNNQADVSGKVDTQTDQDILNDLARSFM